MFIKKRGKAKKAAAEGADGLGLGAAAGGGGGGGGSGGGSGGVMLNEEDFDHRLGNYQLMEGIGKGGYGTVYRGLNIERGMTVAVKRINLQGIPHEELESIEMEIRLLQNLDHPNIVKYLDSIRSDEYLNIILEFVENGSLSSLLGKFQGGTFPEQLCSHYITQVLKGLQYLHTQGVIHRDIKGANILSTKEGQVKLADFGVATKLNESRKSDSVVGTPYWMAPEIIEMTGQQSSACDIWSVGCTTLELLTGKPPYFDLQQMPALFRIVQDEHPPLPDGISPALEDFLLQCFAEDTQLLAKTHRGEFRWMQVDELLEHQQLRSDDGTIQPLLVASFNPSRSTLEYYPLTAPIILRQGVHRMLDVKHAASDVSLSVTHDHTMYARTGRRDKLSGMERWGQQAEEGVPATYRTMPASELRADESAEDEPLVQMQAHASGGIVLPQAVLDAPLPFAKPLGLSTPDQSAAFLELYGFWLCAGSVQRGAVTFHAADPAAHHSLRTLLDRLSLTLDRDFRFASPALLAIHKSSWVDFFVAECITHQQSSCAPSSDLSCSPLPVVPPPSYPPSPPAVLNDGQPTQLLPSSDDDDAALRKLDTAASSAARAFGSWVLSSLSCDQLRLLLQGACTATAGEGDAVAQGQLRLFTSSTQLRDDLLLAGLHAGYSPHFHRCGQRSEEDIPSKDASSDRDRWCVTLDSGVSAEPTLLAHRDLTERAFTGRVWCVTLPPHHLLFVRRILSSTAPSLPSPTPHAPPTITAASRPLVTGQCFQKDPNRRIDAHGLLKHPWLKRSVEMMEVEEMKRKAMEASLITGSMPLKAKRGGHGKGASIGGVDEADESDGSEWDEEDDPATRAKVKLPGSGGSKTPGKKPVGGVGVAGVTEKIVVHTSDNDDDWDADEADDDVLGSDAESFAAAGGAAKLGRPGHKSALSTAAFPQDVKKRAAAVAEANKRSGAGGKAAKVSGKAPAATQKDSEEGDGDGDLVIKLREPVEDDADPFAEFSDEEDANEKGEASEDEDVVSKTSMKTIKPTPAITPAQLLAVGKGPSQKKVLPPISSNASSSAAAVTSASSTLTSTGPPSLNNSVSTTASFSLAVSGAPGSSLSHSATGQGARRLEAFVEDDEAEMEEFEELIGEGAVELELKAPVGASAGASAAGSGGSGGAAHQAVGAPAAAGHRNSKSLGGPVPVTAGEEDGAKEEDDVDPFDDITFEEADDKAEDVLLNRSFLRVLESLTLDTPERSVLEACEKLHELGRVNPELIRNLMVSHGVIPLMEMLESPHLAILIAILKVINQIVGKNIKFAQSMSLVGLIPAIIRFGGQGYPREIRMESANFVRQFCYASDWTRKMFIACDGLPVLVSFLLEEYEQSKTLVWNAIDCIAEGTPVALSTGVSVPIEDVRVGDYVLARAHHVADGREHRGVAPRLVTSVDAKGIRDCIELLFADGRTLVCTKEHRILDVEGKWLAADAIPIGHKVAVTTSCDARVLPLFSVPLIAKREVGPRRVWDLSVPSGDDEFDSFTANGILVHNCIRHVFDITTNPKNDFCRLFCKFGLLEPLTRQLQSIHHDTESVDAPGFVLKIASILHLFSQGDKVVKLHFAKPAVISGMLRVLPTAPQEPLILLLKSIRNISMDATTLDLLEAAGAIPALVPFLAPDAVSENQHQVLLTMYYLCQIKASRQEQAALSGIIPHLQRFIREEHPLKQFAYPIIFLLAKTSARTRLELKKHQGLQFYVDILTSADVYWRSAALDCISYWLSASSGTGGGDVGAAGGVGGGGAGSSSSDSSRIAFLLHTPSNITKLIRVFRDTHDATQFDKMLPSFRKILATSVKVNQSLGRGKEFIREIRARLMRHASSNNIRINLLKMVSLLFAAHPNPAQLAAEGDLLPVFHQLLEDKGAVIVTSLTQKLLAQLEKGSNTQGEASATSHV